MRQAAAKFSEGKEGNCGTGFQRELVNIFLFVLSVRFLSIVYSIYMCLELCSWQDSGQSSPIYSSFIQVACRLLLLGARPWGTFCRSKDKRLTVVGTQGSIDDEAGCGAQARHPPFLPSLLLCVWSVTRCHQFKATCFSPLPLLPPTRGHHHLLQGLRNSVLSVHSPSLPPPVFFIGTESF